MQVIIKKQLLEWGEKHQEICKENNDFDERKVEMSEKRKRITT